MAADVSTANADNGAAGRGRVSPVWPVIVLLLGLFVAAHDFGHMVDTLTGYRGAGDKAGVEFGDCGRDGFCRIEHVAPGSAAAAAGLRDGDVARPDRAIDISRRAGPGETLGLTSRRNGLLSHQLLTIGPLVRAADAASLELSEGLRSAAWLVAALVGMFAVLRSQGRATTLLFGAALICLGLTGTIPDAAESDLRLYPAWATLADLILFAGPVLFIAFAIAARRESCNRPLRGWRTALAAYALSQGVSVVCDLWQTFTGRFPIPNSVFLASGLALEDFGYLLALILLVLAWRESRGQERTRYAFIVSASTLLALSMNVTAGIINLTGDDWSLNNPLMVSHLVGTVVGAGVLGYAVVRHRVLDLGFAVNRTLVYGAVSAVLLAGFGLSEWAVEHFLTIRGREENALLDAAIAVGVFLTFHRVRALVELVIQRLFFRGWQRAEAALRQFVRDGAFATRPDILIRAFAAALSDYSDGAQTAVYLQNEDGGYQLAGGAASGLDGTLDADDRAVMAIRAERRAMIPDHARSKLAAALIAPMVHRNAVIGLAILGPKPLGLDYRPDEIELIGWATHQVGLDLHALKVEQLEADRARQVEQISSLRTEVATLRSIFPQRA